jgi:electron transport complex protein RnfA
MTNLLAILIGAALVNRLVLVRFPAFGPLPVRAGVLVYTLALTLAMAVTWLFDASLFQALDLRELRLPTLILATAAATPLAAVAARLMSPTPGGAASGSQPLIMINGALLGAGLLATREPATLMSAIGWAFATGLGFVLILVLVSEMEKRLEAADIPPPFSGAAIMLVTAGLMSLAFSGIAGLVRG